MSLDKSNMPLSAKQVSVMDRNGKFNYNHIVQRGLVWERSRKTDLIESMILGYPIPQIYCRRDRDETSKKNSSYVIMDGKQRLTTIASFIQNDWALSFLPAVKYDSYDGEEVEMDISGKTFDELPEELQDKIRDTSINFIYFDAILPSEERELFKRLNAGKPLSAKARLIANCKDLDNILDIGNHVLFQDILTENARSQKSQVAIIMKMWAMLNQQIDEVSFEGKNFNKMAEEVVISAEATMILRDVMDMAHGIFQEMMSFEDKRMKKLAKKFGTETHLVSFVPYLYKAYQDGNDDVENLSRWVEDFFMEQDEMETSQYYLACTSGSAKNDNIKLRDSIISESYNKFFEVA